MDKEIHFSVVGPKNIFALANSLELELFNSDGCDITLQDFLNDPDNGIEIGDKNLPELSEKTKESWLNAIAKKGWPVSLRTIGSGYYIIDSEFGKRESSPWSFDIQFDPHEVGDRPEDATMGINLSSRYFPTFLDMHNMHGTLGSIIDFEALHKDIEIAKEEIIKLIPEMADAKIVTRDIWY